MRTKIAGHTSENCPGGGEHSYQMWSGKMRCVKCGQTQG
ncbi:hypothetical protein SAMN05216371_7947 [Streptomyces sp. TLI_053]|nr:hypothetical protein SAMN05216371_7947 [Streptomyces sp. TLI_053]